MNHEKSNQNHNNPVFRHSDGSCHGLKPTDTAVVDGEQLKVMKAAWIDGYEELLDSDYDPIREMAKRVNMPPYQKY